MERENIPVEYLKERPSVFTEKSFNLVNQFTLRFNRLRLPISAEGATAVSPEEMNNFQSFGELSDLVNKRTGELIKNELTGVLADQADWPEDKKSAIIEAAAKRLFAEIEDEDTELMKSALGFALVSERARVNNVCRVLEALPNNVLDRLGMTEKQREIVGRLLKVMTEIDAEYLRHHLHVDKKQPFDERPSDTAVERRFVSRGLEKISADIIKMAQEEGRPVFDSPERDQAFLDYLESLQEAYEPMAEGVTPVALDEHRKRLEKTQQLFLDFHSKYPDFPLILFPAFSHYEADEVTGEETEEAWRSFGFDPELRLYWQSPENRARQDSYTEVQSQLVNRVEKDYAALADTAVVSKYRIILAEPVAASGINIREETISQEEKNLILMVDSDPFEGDEKFQQIFESFLGDEDIELVRTKDFKELFKLVELLHELAHGLHAEESKAAGALGSIDDSLTELKSDLAMWVTASSILKEKAESRFDQKAMRAIQLALLRDAMGSHYKSERDGNKSAYFISAREILTLLLENGVLAPEEGKLQLAGQKLDKDLSPIFISKFKEVLEIYHQAEGTSQDIKEAKARGRSIKSAKGPEILKKFTRKRT